MRAFQPQNMQDAWPCNVDAEMLDVEMFTLIGACLARFAGVSAGRAGDIRQESACAGHHGPGQSTRGAGQRAGGPAPARAGLRRRTGRYCAVLPWRHCSNLVPTADCANVKCRRPFFLTRTMKYLLIVNSWKTYSYVHIQRFLVIVLWNDTLYSNFHNVKNTIFVLFWQHFKAFECGVINHGTCRQ